MTTNPRRRPLDPSITEDLIEAVVDRFYAKVRSDRRLGPIFAGAIGDDWRPHLRKMCDFWSSVMRLSGRYKGKPVQAHFGLRQLTPQDFTRWLDLFCETVHELCDPQVATLFIQRAERIADTLALGDFSQQTPHTEGQRAPRPAQPLTGGSHASPR